MHLQGINMNKFLEWFGRNRKTIGYSVGGMNMLSGLGQIASGNFWYGVMWIIGAALILDAHEFK